MLYPSASSLENQRPHQSSLVIAECEGGRTKHTKQDSTDGFERAKRASLTWRLARISHQNFESITTMWVLLRSFGALAWLAVIVQASSLHLHQNRKTMRGGSLDTAAPKLRKYGESDRMPSLFNDGEQDYDLYSACLAATEGLRRLRDRDLAEEVQNTRDAEEAARNRKQIAVRYIQNSGKVLRALGMSVGHFNELGREVSKDDRLKEKVSSRRRRNCHCIYFAPAWSLHVGTVLRIYYTTDSHRIFPNAPLSRSSNKPICTEWRLRFTSIVHPFSTRGRPRRVLRNTCRISSGIKSNCFVRV
jgi:hypothetical protein